MDGLCREPWKAVVGSGFERSEDPRPCNRLRPDIRLLTLILAALFTALACDARLQNEVLDAEAARGNEPRVASEVLLERAAKALRDARTVRYDFRYGDLDEPTGFATGTTWMERVERLEDSRIRVEGTMHAQPRFGTEEVLFTYATDGNRAWSRVDDEEAEVATTGQGNNRLSALAVYGFLPEFVEADPLWRERSMAVQVDWEGAEVVDGVNCDVIRVVIPLSGGESSSIVWWLGSEDHLPRRGRWISERSGPLGVTFELSGLEVGIALADDLFDSPAQVRVADSEVAIGDRAPEWALEGVDGRMISSKELLGQVVVLDFWNTWCPICRSIAPATYELARAYRGRPVRFFGVNLLELNDPEVYWAEVEPPFPLLLQGEELANRLDLPWQPGLAVIGPDGVLLHKQFGASADRVEMLTDAIERGLGQVSESGR